MSGLSSWYVASRFYSNFERQPRATTTTHCMRDIVTLHDAWYGALTPPEEWGMHTCIYIASCSHIQPWWMIRYIRDSKALHDAWWRMRSYATLCVLVLLVENHHHNSPLTSAFTAWAAGVASMFPLPRTLAGCLLHYYCTWWFISARMTAIHMLTLGYVFMLLCSSFSLRNG